MVGMLKLHPFLALFIFIAKNRFPQYTTLGERFDRLTLEQPWLYRICVFFDFVFTLILVAIAVVVIAVSAWKAVGSPLVLP